MNSREIDQMARRLAGYRGWGDFEDPRTAVLVLLISRKEDARRRLKDYIEDLRHNLDGLERMLSTSSPLLNELGELQSRPAALEAAVGAFIAANRTLADYLAAFPPVEA